jgi:hypothetical protein
MKNNNNEDEVLNSLRGIKRAEASPFLFTRIEHKLKGISQEKPMGIFSVVSLSLAFSLLIGLNVWMAGSNVRDKPAKSLSGYRPDNANFNIY